MTTATPGPPLRPRAASGAALALVEVTADRGLRGSASHEPPSGNSSPSVPVRPGGVADRAGAAR